MDQAPRRNRGQFQPKQSGNPRGRPRRQDAADSPTTALATTRRDGWVNRQSGHGTARDRRTLTEYGVDVVTDIEALQLRRSEFLAAAIIEQGPKEALKRPWYLKCEDKELGNAIRKQAEALGLDQVLYDAWTKENEAGGAAIFPVISGAQGDLSTPLDEKAIASVDAFHVFEPQELTPAAYYNDIRSPKFRKPAAYRLQPINSGRGGYLPMAVIHETRLVIFPGLRTSEQVQPGQREGWGDSRLCRPRQVMADFGLAWGSAATLLHGHGKETMEMDGLAQMLSQADGLAEFDRHIAAMQMAWSTLRMNVIDGKSKISRSTGTLAGVSDLLNEFKSLMAAAAERPVSILMGVGSTGLRTGDDDTRAWYSTVERDRTQHLQPRHEHIVRLQFLATAGPGGGVEPEAWSVEYPPLWSPSEKEVAETRKTDMERAKIAIDSGVASSDDVAESFYKGDTYSGDIVINWDRRTAQAKIDAEPAAQIEQDPAAMEALGRAPPSTSSARNDRDYVRAPDGRFGNVSGVGHVAATAAKKSAALAVSRTPAEMHAAITASRHATAHAVIAHTTLEGGKFTASEQHAIRSLTVGELAHHGFHLNKGEGAGPHRGMVTVKPVSEMPANPGLITPKGEMVLTTATAKHLTEFYNSDPRELGSKVAGARRPTDYPEGRTVFAYHVATHEEMHACGPQIFYHQKGVAVEEFTTELSARHVTANRLGIDSVQLRGTYNPLIMRNVVGIQKASGASAPDAYRALESASIKWKRSPDTGKVHSGDEAMHEVAKSALEHLNIHDHAKTTELVGHMTEAWRAEYGG